MTPADEARFIELWPQGLDTATLVRQGKIQPRPRGGAYPRQKAQARQGQANHSTATVQSSAETPTLTPDEAKAERWNLWFPRGLRQRIEAIAKARGHAPSKVVQEALWQWIAAEESHT